MYETKPELIGIYNNGVVASGGGSDSPGGSATPDGSGGLVINVPINVWRSYTDLGSAASVTISAGQAYKLAVPVSCSMNAVVSSGYLGPNAHITMVLAEGATVTAVPPLYIQDTLVAGTTNECTVTFRDGNAYLYRDTPPTADSMQYIPISSSVVS